MIKQRRRYLAPYWKRLSQRWLATVIFSLAVTTFVCGLSGFAWQYAAFTSIDRVAEAIDPLKSQPSQDWSIPMYKTVQLYLLNSGAEDDPDHPSNLLLIIARFAAATLFLVVSATVISKVLDDVRRLPSHLMRRDHVVICGLGQIGLQLLDDLHMKGRASEVVIVENDHENCWLEYAKNLGATNCYRRFC